MPEESLSRQELAGDPLADPGQASGPAAAAPGGPARKNFTCRNCGAKITYDPAAGSLKCPYCSSEQAIPRSAAEIQELDFRACLAQAADRNEALEAQVAKCPSCGAQISGQESLASLSCPYCDTPIVRGEGSVRSIKPRSLLPFKVPREKAWGALQQWVGGLWFAPGKLKRYATQEDKLSGVYVPYWTYDCHTTSYYTGERGEDYWATERYTATENGRTVTRTRQVRKTRWYPAEGTVFNRFDDILILASEALPRDYTEKLEPWDFENLVPYSDEYLSGFRTESYQLGLAEGFERARVPMDAKVEESACADIGGDHQRIGSIKTSYENIAFKHLLLPVWISSYRFRNKVYRFMVNARTGEVQGERPWSVLKILLAVLAGLGVVGGTIALLSQLH